MGTPRFAVPSLERLIADGHQVAAVFTQPDKPAGRGGNVQLSPVKEAAIAAGIPVYQPAKIKNNEEVRQLFQKLAPDACVVAAYGRILPQWLLDIPSLGCINVHASLLPKYRGAAPINWAIANGESVTGITIMRMDAGMDTGPIWAIRETPIHGGETAGELGLRLSAIGAELLSETLPLIERGQIHSTPQDETRATYAPILKREHGLIEWSLPAWEIANRVLGFQPWPGSYTIFKGLRLIIWKAQAMEASPVAVEGTEGDDTASASLNTLGEIPTGSVVAADKTGFAVLCGALSRLHVEEVQIEGKRRVTAKDFLNGARIKAGDRLI